MKISANLSRPAIRALSCESAISPPSAESGIAGRMKTIVASRISRLAFSPPKRKRMSMTSILRTKLSLNAEKNWHQNSGANRRDVIRVRNMMAGVLGRCLGRMGRRNPAARQAGTGDLAIKTSTAADRRLHRLGSAVAPAIMPSLQHVANADAQLLRSVVLLHRQARLRVDKPRDLTAVEVAIADVER